MFIHACDCSPTAIAALQANPEHDPRRCNAFVADLSSGDHPLKDHIPDASIDAVTGVFFFSALDAAAFARVARECERVLRPGGVVLFRDYSADDVKNGGGGGGGAISGGVSEGDISEGDGGGNGGGNGGSGSGSGGGGGGGSGGGETVMGEEKMAVSSEVSDSPSSSAPMTFEPGAKVAQDTYVRGDGTLAVFTDGAAVETIFRGVGLEGECWLVGHEIVNRKLGVCIRRSYVQGRFEKPSPS